MSLLLRLLCLLIVTGGLLHVVAHLYDVVLRATCGHVIDPASLSNTALHGLLDDWGVDYRHVGETSDLVHMVKQLGPLDEQHVKSVQTADTAALTPDTSFTSGYTFYQDMTSRKNTDVWLVMVVTALNESLAESNDLDSWTSVRKRVARLGVRTGILDCKKSAAYCEVREWVTPRFLLVIPQKRRRPRSRRAESASVHVYKDPLHVRSILTWFEERLQEKIVSVVSVTDLHSFKKWLTSGARSGPAFRAVFFTDQTTTPALLSMASIQYMDMVQFGVIRETNGHLLKWMKENNVGGTFPQMMILSRDGIYYVYGKAVGEYLSLASLHNFFDMFTPSWILQLFLVCVTLAITSPVCFGNTVVAFLCVLTIMTQLSERETKNMFHFSIAFITWWGVLVPGKSLLSMALGTPFPVTAPLLTTIPMGSCLLQDLFFYTQHSYILLLCLAFACFCLDQLMLWVDFVDMAPFLIGLPQVHPYFLPRSPTRSREITSVPPATSPPGVDSLQPADQQESDNDIDNSETGSVYESQTVIQTTAVKIVRQAVCGGAKVFQKLSHTTEV